MDYNAITRKVETKAFFNSESSYRKVQELNAAGDVVSEYLYSPYKGKEYLCSVTKYTYDANRKKTNEYSKVDDSYYSGGNTKETKKAFEYDAQGQLTRVNETARTNNGPENSYYTVYTLSEQGTKLGRKYDSLREQLDAIEHYDEAGNLIQEDVYAGIYPYKTNFWKYDAAGNLIEHSYRYEEAARVDAGKCEPGVIYLKQKCEYDSNGNQTAAYLFADDGEIMNEYHSVYNEKNEKIKSSSKFCLDGYVDERCGELTYEVTIQEIGADAQPASASPDKFDFDSARTMYETACNYYNGDGGVERNGDMAFSWAKKTTTTYPDFAEAWNLLGKCYSVGVGTVEDHNRAISAYEKAAALGNTDFIYELAEEYYFNCEDAKDRAAHWLDRSIEKGDIYAMTLRGYMYLYGVGGPQDIPKGERLLTTASEKGDAEASRQLAQFYDKNGNKNKFGYYSTLAVSQGSTNGRIIESAALACFFGIGVNEDEEKARHLFEQVAFADDTNLIFDTPYYDEASLYLGVMYCNGIGGPIDKASGEQLLRRAIDSKYKNIISESADVLGLKLYAAGIHMDTAIQLIRQAVAAGNSNALVSLGFAYLEGKGVPQNTATAISYWEQAAQQGNETAIENLKKMQSDAAPSVTPQQFTNMSGKSSGCVVRILKFFGVVIIISLLMALVSELLR